jgi:hypothetical protein
MHRHAAVLAFSLVVGASSPSLAQTDMAAMGRVAAANNLGILEYCQDQGHVGPEAVAAEKDAIGRMPASGAPTDAAEALGKQGNFSAPNGQTMTLETVASKQGSTVPAVCKQLGNAAIQSAAMYKQNGMGEGGMPAMQGMPKMPAMPQMPAMPPASPQQ